MGIIFTDGKSSKKTILILEICASQQAKTETRIGLGKSAYYGVTAVVIVWSYSSFREIWSGIICRLLLTITYKRAFSFCLHACFFGKEKKKKLLLPRRLNHDESLAVVIHSESHNRSFYPVTQPKQKNPRPKHRNSEAEMAMLIRLSLIG